MAFFAICIFLSAFLIFQIEPMIAKVILPWFGGTSAVWSSVVLFFQVLLTGGYAYADWLLRSRRRQITVHLALLGASLALLLILGLLWKSPITPSAVWKPEGTSFPIWGIFKILIITVGLPYFLLSSNSPLIQTWFHHEFQEKTAYRLYALSNVGSLLGLLTYPVLVEPYLTLAWQGRIWSFAYLIFAVMVAFGAIRSFRQQQVKIIILDFQSDDPRPSVKLYLLWILLAATASVLLLAVTSKITQEVAAIPFLWVLPLSVYLLTFVLAFSGDRWFSRQIFILLFFAATLLAGRLLVRPDDFGILIQIGVYTLVLFAACMICHGELYRLRPPPAHLAAFYLMVSIGGALGGILVNFVAPYVFKGYWELPIGLVWCWFIFLIVILVSRKTHYKRWIFVANGVLLVSAIIVAGYISYQQIRSDLINDLFIQRNFYGVLRVRQRDFYAVIPIHLGDLTITAYHRFALIHGAIIHGYQFHDDMLRDLPTSYYGKRSGGALAILNHPQRGKGMRVGVLGLGVGTLANYGQPRDVYRFYEINPEVIRLAEGEKGYFTYLSDSQAKIEIVPGDARLSLERELAADQLQNYDVLLLDVFSSDSIPVHLLDAEAFKVYLEQLSSEGILAVHISNRNLDLVPVVWTLAGHFGLAKVLIDVPGDGVITYPSTWFLLARDAHLLDNPAIAGQAKPMQGYVSDVRLWTDDYNNLFQILK